MTTRPGSGQSGTGRPGSGGEPADDELQADLPRTDWRDTLRVAADVALLGIVMVVAAFPVVTAGASVATASAALHGYLRDDRWPELRGMWTTFRRGLLPGLAVTLIVMAGVALITVDLIALRAGAVPGGTPLIVLTSALAAVGAGWAALVVVAVGRTDGRGWAAAVRTVRALIVERPTSVLAATGVVVLVALLVSLVHPALSPVLAGYALFALHAVDRRRRNTPPGSATRRAPARRAAVRRAAPGPATVPPPQSAAASLQASTGSTGAR